MRSRLRAVRRSFQLARLRRSGRPLAVRIAHTVAAVDARPPPEEARWFDRLESARAELNGSTERLVRLDFGVGSPTAPHTPEQMAAGVPVETTVGELATLTSKPARWCRLLFHLARELEPTTCLELGTAVGMSSSYLAAALATNGRGTLVTLEGAPTVAAIARATHRRLGLDDVEVVEGRFQDTLGETAMRCGPLALVFIDGHHEETATQEYFEAVLPHLTEPAVVVFDDIDWSAGMIRAWRALAVHPSVALGVDLGPVGVTVVAPSRPSGPPYSVRL